MLQPSAELGPASWGRSNYLAVFALLLWELHGFHILSTEYKSSHFGFGLSRWEGLLELDPKTPVTNQISLHICHCLWAADQPWEHDGKEG